MQTDAEHRRPEKRLAATKRVDFQLTDGVDRGTRRLEDVHLHYT